MKFAIIAEQRFREDMEDAHSVAQDFIEPGWIFGGIYDGHGSIRPAQIASEIIPRLFREKIVKHSPGWSFRMVYKEASTQVSGSAYCGTCAANFFIRRGILYHANAGDVSIIVIGKKLVNLTADHRVTSKTERERIIAHGGQIEGVHVWHPSNNGIMPTRTLGDQAFKPLGITYVPSTGSYKIKRSDKFLIAATDGLTDKVTISKIESCARNASDAEDLANKLKQLVEERRGSDNLTVIVGEL